MPRKERISRPGRRRWSTLWVNLVGGILVVTFLFPIYWTFLTSLRSESEILKWPPDLLPVNLTLSNYGEIMQRSDTPVLRWFWNSSIAALSYATLSLFVCVPAAYALSRLQFKFRDLYFKVLLASLTIPGMILFLPNYTTVDALGWTDSLVAIILPGLGATIGVFLLRQFFIGIPREMEEAALMDGAGVFQRIFRIIIPMSREAIITLWIMNFMANWNDYLWPLVTLYSPEKRTLPVGMSTLQGAYVHYYGVIMAGAVLIALPSIVIFLLVQRYYVKGISIGGGLKE